MRKKTLLTIILLLATNAAAALQPEDISFPVIRIICGIYTGLKLIAGGLGTLIIVYGAVKWMTEVEDPGARKNAKSMIKIVLVGLIIIILADTIIYETGDQNVIQSCTFWCGIPGITC